MACPYYFLWYGYRFPKQDGVESRIMTETIKLTGNVVTLRSDRPERIGTKMNLEVRLPDGVLLESFALNGTITSCTRVGDNGVDSYILEMKIGDIPPRNREILKAYVDFLEREDMLKGLKTDLKALEEVFSDFGERLRQLKATSEVMRRELEGLFEVLMRNSGKKTTIH